MPSPVFITWIRPTDSLCGGDNPMRAVSKLYNVLRFMFVTRSHGYDVISFIRSSNIVGKTIQVSSTSSCHMPGFFFFVLCQLCRMTRSLLRAGDTEPVKDTFWLLTQEEYCDHRPWAGKQNFSCCEQCLGQPFIYTSGISVHLLDEYCVAFVSHIKQLTLLALE